MADDRDEQLAAAHRYFSAHCFNEAWGLIDKPERTEEEDQQVILLAHASLYHWTQRPDCTAKNVSIGYWQLSRVYALLGQAENASRFADLCLRATPTDEAFCLGYAHEACARAAALRGNRDAREQHLREAQRVADSIEDAEEKKLLQADLETIP